MTRVHPEPLAIPHPLACEDPQSEALAYALRQQSGCGRLISLVQDLGRADWLVARPGQRMGLLDLLQAAHAAQAYGVVVDTTDEAAAQDWIAAQQSRLALMALPQVAQRAGILAAAFYGRPSDRLSVTGITGTNGKTTVARGLARSLAWQGRAAVAVGTLGIHRLDRRGDEILEQPLAEAGLTSLDAVSLQRRLADCLAAGVQEVVLEASSIGLLQGRLAGCRFTDVALTSFSQDHLDVHKTMDDYAHAKGLLFQAPHLQGSVRARPIAGQQALPPVLANGPDVLWVAVARDRDAWEARTTEAQEELVLCALDQGPQGTRIGLALPRQPRADATCWFVPPGLHNLQNAAVVAGLLYRRGFSAEDILDCLARFETPPGRMQPVPLIAHANPLQRPAVYVDYAHTPDALHQALAGLRPIAQARGGQLVCVFGCGGNRDPGKRPQMGEQAALGADWIVLTSDNPRHESPEAIAQEILSGLAPEARRRCLVELDRARAIERAIDMATAADVLLIAGKGHETTQEVAGSRLPFSDAACAASVLADWYPMPTLSALLDGLTRQGLATGRRYGAAGLGLWADRPPASVSIDSRVVTPGALFLALGGARSDGHDYLGQAFAQGAAAALVSRAPTEAQKAEGLGPCFEVTDVEAALSALSAQWRGAWRGRLAAVTGSNGKTTVKEMSAAVLRAAHGSSAVWATPGNLNNHLGVPLSLLGLRARHRVAVLEIGMNHPGEISGLAALAAPDLALVTNAQREHQEFMASVRACAEENAQTFQWVSPGGLVVVPRDPDHEPLWWEMTQGRPDLRHLRFGLAQDDCAQGPLAYTAECLAEVQATLPLAFGLQLVSQTSRQAENDPQFAQPAEGHVSLLGIGRHLARNASGAAALGLGLGISMEAVVQGLNSFVPVAGRGRVHSLDTNQWLVDDSYNANPDSVLAAITALASVEGAHALALGDMGEVGDQGPAFHAEVLQAAQAHQISPVLVFGKAFSEAALRTQIGQPYSDIDALISALTDWLDGRPTQAAPMRQTVWVKGSRFMRMERVVQAILHRKEQHASAGLSVTR
ncbi:MAG: bifunctional UDP-N-acetylmuramoyl-L-alanyl-D-glutamate--2,6-diaminopimelate ligase [Pseudomonadota bacterium]